MANAVMLLSIGMLACALLIGSVDGGFKCCGISIGSVDVCNQSVYGKFSLSELLDILRADDNTSGELKCHEEDVIEILKCIKEKGGKNTPVDNVTAKRYTVEKLLRQGEFRSEKNCQYEHIEDIVDEYYTSGVHFLEMLADSHIREFVSNCRKHRKSRKIVAGMLRSRDIKEMHQINEKFKQGIRDVNSIDLTNLFTDNLNYRGACKMYELMEPACAELGEEFNEECLAIKRDCDEREELFNRLSDLNDKNERQRSQYNRERYHSSYRATTK